MANPTLDIEKALARGRFVPVAQLSACDVPEEYGLYCIKLNAGCSLPAKFGKIRQDRIIYIGKAEGQTLRKRLWEQELNHKTSATFFKSIGAMLGYVPPKGSLAGKKSKNYKFSHEDTESIRVWMRKSLSVNFVVLPVEKIGKTETDLIERYRPLVNIDDNPTPSMELKEARRRCLEYAKSAQNVNKAQLKKQNTTTYSTTHYPQSTQPYEAKPWYKRASNWGWIFIGIFTLIIIGLIIDAGNEVKIESQRPKEKRTYWDIFTPEEMHKMGFDIKMDGADIVNTSPNAAKNVREFIEKGGNADPAVDAIQDGDYHDLLDQNGGPEGF